jgi:predicted outer membrane repeat protein
MHRKFLLFTFLLSCVVTSTLAAPVDKTLLKLDPEERAHQACAVRGLQAIRRDKALPAVDRIKTGATSRAQFKGNTVTANGGAVRSKHQWYKFTYKCDVTADQMKATSFTYKIGEVIPEDEWEDYGLWR